MVYLWIYLSRINFKGVITLTIAKGYFSDKQRILGEGGSTEYENNIKKNKLALYTVFAPNESRYAYVFMYPKVILNMLLKLWLIKVILMISREDQEKVQCVSKILRKRSLNYTFAQKMSDDISVDIIYPELILKILLQLWLLKVILMINREYGGNGTECEYSFKKNKFAPNEYWCNLK